jgi:hypothetical protein
LPKQAPSNLKSTELLEASAASAATATAAGAAASAAATTATTTAASATDPAATATAAASTTTAAFTAGSCFVHLEPSSGHFHVVSRRDGLFDFFTIDVNERETASFDDTGIARTKCAEVLNQVFFGGRVGDISHVERFRSHFFLCPRRSRGFSMQFVGDSDYANSFTELRNVSFAKQNLTDFLVIIRRGFDFE